MPPRHQCVDGDGSNEDEADKRGRRHAERAASAPLRVVNGTFGAVTVSPSRDRVREHIMVDLVASA